MEPWRTMDAHNEGKMEPWRFCRPVVVDSHHFDEDQDPDPHEIEKLDPGTALK